MAWPFLSLFLRKQPFADGFDAVGDAPGVAVAARPLAAVIFAEDAVFDEDGVIHLRVFGGEVVVGEAVLVGVPLSVPHGTGDFYAVALQALGDGVEAGEGAVVVFGGHPPDAVFRKRRNEFRTPFASNQIACGKEVGVADVHGGGGHAAAGLAGGVQAFCVDVVFFQQCLDEVDGAFQVFGGAPVVVGDDFVVLRREYVAGAFGLFGGVGPDDGAQTLIEGGPGLFGGYARVVHEQHQRQGFGGILGDVEVVFEGLAGVRVGKFALAEFVGDEVVYGAGVQGFALYGDVGACFFDADGFVHFLSRYPVGFAALHFRFGFGCGVGYDVFLQGGRGVVCGELHDDEAAAFGRFKRGALRGIDFFHCPPRYAVFFGFEGGGANFLRVFQGYGREFDAVAVYLGDGGGFGGLACFGRSCGQAECQDGAAAGDDELSSGEAVVWHGVLASLGLQLGGGIVIRHKEQQLAALRILNSSV